MNLNDNINSLALSMDVFINNSLYWVGKLIMAYIIWLIGKFLINLAVNTLKKLDIKNTYIDDTIRNTLVMFLVPVAKVVLFLVILDTLGIGSNVLSAITNALSLTIAIAFGLAFGRSLEPYAVDITGRFLRNYRANDREREGRGI